MAVVHTLVLFVALVALLPMVCLVSTLAVASELRGRAFRACARRAAARRQRRLVDRLERAVEETLSADPQVLAALDAPGRPSIEDIAADLRRLGRLRLGVARTSSVWHDAIMLAYDDRLRLACRYLGVAEHLDRLGGVDLEIERVRVEGELLGMGLVLRGTSRWGKAA